MLFGLLHTPQDMRQVSEVKAKDFIKELYNNDDYHLKTGNTDYYIDKLKSKS
jgi:hypothetical protein